MKNLVKYIAIFLLFTGFSYSHFPNKITLQEILGTYSTLGHFTEIVIKENYFEETDLNSEIVSQQRGKVHYYEKNNILQLYDIEYNKNINDKANKWLKATDTTIISERIPTQRNYQPVKFGYFLHLVPEDFEKWYKSIFYCYNSKSSSATLPFPRKELKKFTKIPTIPKNYHHYLVHKTINAKLIKIINDTTFIVNAGKKNGVIAQLTFFHTESDAEFKVKSIDNNTSVLQLTYSPLQSTDIDDTFEKIYKPKIGHLFTTYSGLGID